jgi:hypothetical protein
VPVLRLLPVVLKLIAVHRDALCILQLQQILNVPQCASVAGMVRVPGELLAE